MLTRVSAEDKRARKQQRKSEHQDNIIDDMRKIKSNNIVLQRDDLVTGSSSKLLNKYGIFTSGVNKNPSLGVYVTSRSDFTNRELEYSELDKKIKNEETAKTFLKNAKSQIKELNDYKEKYAINAEKEAENNISIAKEKLSRRPDTKVNENAIKKNEKIIKNIHNDIVNYKNSAFEEILKAYQFDPYNKEILHWYGSIHILNDRQDESFPLIKKAYDEYVKEFGAEHEETITVKNKFSHLINDFKEDLEKVFDEDGIDEKTSKRVNAIFNMFNENGVMHDDIVYLEARFLAVQGSLNEAFEKLNSLSQEASKEFLEYKQRLFEIIQEKSAAPKKK